MSRDTKIFTLKSLILAAFFRVFTHIGTTNWMPSTPVTNRARNKGVSAFIGEGINCWPAVHRLDAAHLFRLVLESETTGVYHAVAEEGVAFKEIAAVIGERLNVPVKSIAREEANNHFTWFTHFAEMDLNSSSEKTKEKLGWKPKQHGLLNDIDSLNYFKLKS